MHDYLTEAGYTVRAEVEKCDITAVRGDELVVVELKCGFTVDLLVQASQRQRAADSVYVALPRPHNRRDSRWRGAEHLLRRLELGLLLVHPGPGAAVEVVFHPIPFEPRRNTKARGAIIREVSARSGDYNLGGSCRTALVTAYRENAIFIGCCLQKSGPLTPKRLRALGTGPKTLSIVRRNVYGWFVRLSRGIYGLTEQGSADLAAYPELVAHYWNKAAAMESDDDTAASSAANRS